MADRPARPRPGRAESRESAELRALKQQQPALADAIDMHLELLEVQHRLQARIPLPSLNVNDTLFRYHQAQARPLLSFEDIPLELTELRLAVRQTADILHRFGALEDAEFQTVEALGRDAALLSVVGDWYRTPVEASATDQVVALAMRPFLSRCAEVVQQRPELADWQHPTCALCGGAPDFAVITPNAERHLICSRCGLRWKFEPLTCPYCRNSDRSRITSFATPDGRYRVYGCDACRRYLKAYDGRRAPRPVMPVVDGVATLPLDAAAMQRGYTGG
ncbi:MAG: formate dehydrogenase accessory protein FdhE [Acidobacteria bacterium]|nr:formate dehydrogenase accessory protein FdhE [Acidobacteriota bacterium]